MPGTHGRESPGGTSLPATGIQYDLLFRAQYPPTFRQPFFSGTPSEGPSAPVGRPVSPLSEALSTLITRQHLSEAPSALIGKPVNTCQKYCQKPAGNPPSPRHSPAKSLVVAPSSPRRKPLPEASAGSLCAVAPPRTLTDGRRAARREFPPRHSRTAHAAGTECHARPTRRRYPAAAPKRRNPGC